MFPTALCCTLLPREIAWPDADVTVQEEMVSRRKCCGSGEGGRGCLGNRTVQRGEQCTASLIMTERRLNADELLVQDTSRRAPWRGGESLRQYSGVNEKEGSGSLYDVCRGRERR